jgi:hypothetical protein
MRGIVGQLNFHNSEYLATGQQLTRLYLQSPTFPILFAIVMAAILETDAPSPSRTVYADDMNESAAGRSIITATQSLALPSNIRRESPTGRFVV